MNKFELKPLNAREKSFYKKAEVRVEGTAKHLYSYDSYIATYDNGKLTLSTNQHLYTATTRRHLREFIIQTKGLVLSFKEAYSYFAHSNDKFIFPFSHGTNVFVKVYPSGTLLLYKYKDVGQREPLAVFNPDNNTLSVHKDSNIVAHFKAFLETRSQYNTGNVPEIKVEAC
jgi:hypothetical protein